jgi:hypothetical protein
MILVMILGASKGSRSMRDMYPTERRSWLAKAGTVEFGSASAVPESHALEQ